MRCETAFLGAVAAVLLLFATVGTANAICPHTTVKEVVSVCLDRKCPPGIQSYWATIINRFPYKLYITYAFRSGKRDASIIPGGLELQPNSALRQPIGLGRHPLPKEDSSARTGRLRILECGTDPDIRYKWRLR